MTVPAAVPYSTLPAGGVFEYTFGNYWIKSDSATSANLGTGAILATFNDATPVIFYPQASLKLS